MHVQVSNSDGLSPDFDRRLLEGLRDARQSAALSSVAWQWLWRALIALPFLVALCWAVLPWTSGLGIRSLIGAGSYATLVLAMGASDDHSVLGYLGLSAAPAIIDALLLIGVCSWLSWASSRDYPDALNADGERD
jgi:hypothetical protein